MHIGAPWNGPVTVVLPVASPVVGVAHRARRGWRIEPAKTRNGLTRVRVRSLSVFDTNEQVRYAVETMNLPYTAFLARKADFTSHGCSEPRLANECRKPPPYNAFNWTDDGCSPSWVPAALYRNLFNGPCQQHDFGYRNFGNGPRLGRDENTRAWIDRRFAQEMGRLCTDNFSHPLQTANEIACKSEAGYVAVAVRHLGRSAYYKAAEPGPPPPPPEPAPTQTPPPSPPPVAPQPAPAPDPSPAPQPPPQPRGFRISDVFLGGTWARTDPNDGTWYSRGNRPANAAYWYPNGLGVGVDCARRAAGYTVLWADGHTEIWNVWFHVTDGKWYPSAASAETVVNDTYGLPGC